MTWTALRKTIQPPSCGPQCTWWPGHDLFFQPHLATSWPTSLYTNSYSLTTPSRYRSVYLCGSCTHYIQIFPSEHPRMLIYGSNKISSRQHTTMSWVLKCAWQQRFISCFKTKKAQNHPSLPWKCLFLMYKMNRWSPKSFSESTIQIHFWRIIRLYLSLLINSRQYGAKG